MLIITSQHFSWNPATQCFAGEASELEAEMLRQGATRLDHRTGQWGFHMRSHRTGQLLWFRRATEHRDADGDIVHVEFSANLATGKTIKLLVFND